MRAFYLEHGHVSLKDDMTPAERAKVDAELEKVRPTKRKIGEITETVPIGASGYTNTVEDTEEDLSKVDVLDDTASVGENDVEADEKALYTDDYDAKNADNDDAAPLELTSSGAKWIEGLRIGPELMAMLKNHQIEAISLMVERLRANTGCLIAHAMGLGKTLTVLAFLHLMITPSRAHALLLCPKAVVNQWSEESFKWRNVIDVVTFPLESFDEHTVERVVHQWQQSGGLLIIQYDQFHRVSELPLDDETVVIFDEAHLLKSPGTQLHSAANAIPSRRRIMLTGTPLQNNLDEYYVMSELISPGLLGKSLSAFRQEYASVIERGMLRDSTDEERLQGERTTQVLRWRMQDVMHDMPATYLKVSIPPKTEYAVGIKFPPIPETGNPIAEYHALSDLTRGCKVEVACSLIDFIVENDPNESIIVFSNRHETLHQIKAQREGYLYTGSIQGSKRSTVLNDFEANGGILYIATKAGGTGLNLTRASRIIQVDISWNPVYDTQAVARVFRMGQVRPTFIYRLVAQNTMEERIYRMNVQKHAMAARIKDDQDILRLYSQSELKSNDTASIADISPPLPIDRVQDVIMRAAMLKDSKRITVFDHDANFVDEDATLSDADVNSALNDYHRMVALNGRTLVANAETEASQWIAPGQVFFSAPEQDKMVPAYTPYFEREDAGKVKLFLGPFPQYELQRSLNDADWVDMETADSLTLVVLLEATGTYRFRARTTHPTTGEPGPWSDPSAVFTY